MIILWCEIFFLFPPYAILSWGDRVSRQKALADRSQYVVKANDLIRKTRYDLTTQQQKIILFAISKIKPNDPVYTQYELNLEELCEACGLNIDAGGYYYKSLKEDLRKLAHREWCVLPDGTETTISWIGDATIIPLNSTVYITFNPHMEPYLFELRNRYTQYKLQNVLVFRGKYAIRLYEILRSYTTQTELDNDIEKDIDIKLKELRNVLAVSSYPRWADFDRYVIRPAIEEINECAEDIHIEYEALKNGRKVDKVLFIISSADVKQQFNARNKRRSRLDRNPYYK